MAIRIAMKRDSRLGREMVGSFRDMGSSPKNVENGKMGIVPMWTARQFTYP